MRNSDYNDILNHLFIEFKYGKFISDDTITSESHGFVDRIVDYTNRLGDAVIVKMLPLWKDDIKECRELFDIDIFYAIPTFFEQCAINVIIKKNREIKCRGEYKPNDSSLELRNGCPYYNMAINITIESPDFGTVIEILEKAFAHELMHAYEDYKRRLTNSNVEKAELNKLDETELNAIIGDIKAELSKDKSKIKDSKTAMEAIKKTDAWQRYKCIEDNIEVVQKNNFINTVSKIAYDVYCSTMIFDDFNINKTYGKD